MHRLRVLAVAGILGTLGAASGSGQDTTDSTPPPSDIQISASISARPLVTAAARIVKQRNNLTVAIAANLTSSDDLQDLSDHKAGIAFVTRALTGEDRARFPEIEFNIVPVGMQVVALGVSPDVWQGGVHSITQKAMRDIYEHKITNWKELGGPDEKISLFSFEEGEGVWEMFAAWLYGDARKAPLPKGSGLANSQDARDALEFTPGGIAPIGGSMIDGKRCFALGLDLSPKIVQPLPAQAASGDYPMARPLMAVLNGPPTNSKRVFTDFMTGPDGQKLVRNSGAFGLEAVPKSVAGDGN